MALYAFDGTWNEDEEDPADDTNVVKFRDIYRRNGGRAEFIPGVGTRFGSIGRFFGGVFGMGGQTRIEEMYDKLVANWQNDDHVIDIVGFSRGAALGLHFANVIDQAGIKDGDTVLEPNPTVRFLGLWDVVASFGIPINFVLNFHDINLGYDLTVPASVGKCAHAMALDERRQTFRVTRLNRHNSLANVEEVWFRGVHSDVGGGNDNAALSNIAMHWMLQRAAEAGLPIEPADLDNFSSFDRFAPPGENLDPIQNPKRVVLADDQIHPTARGAALAVGESREFTVFAKHQFNWSGVRVVAGGRYVFEIPDGEKWKDKCIVCGPDGWLSEDLPWYKEEFVELLEGRRRVPKANWFELIGSIGDDEDLYFRIGKGGDGAPYDAPEDGELYAFANDLRSMYGNNAGELSVTVRRIS